MPNFGAPAAESGNVGLGIVPYSNANERDQIGEFHRNRERERMNIPDMPEPVIELSQEQRVYIYNVGPRRFQQDLASYGSRVIHPLAEEMVFGDKDGKPNVSTPLVIDGIPFEFYPSEGEAKVIYHRPPKNMGRNSKRPGYDFAMEVIGCGRMVNPSCDLRPFGVFISEFPEPDKPAKGSPQAESDRYAAWISAVKTAQAALRKKCADICQEANVEYSRGNFKDVRHDELYQMARLIRGTEAQYPWLKDTADKAENTACIGCGFTLKAQALKCGSCGTLQVSEEAFAAEIKKRQANRL